MALRASLYNRTNYMIIKYFIIITALISTVFAAEAQDLSKYPFKHGSFVLIREVSNNGDGPVMTSSRETTWFMNYGEQKATEIENELNLKGMIVLDHQLSILNMTEKATTLWNLDLTRKTGTKSTINRYNTDSNTVVETKEFGEETYLGYACKKRRVKYANGNELTALMYGDLAMKTELTTKNGEKISTRIISIDLTLPPKSKFKAPKDVKITEQKTT
jgi:hypothetical protein